MYVINPEEIDSNKLYKSNRFIAEWLIYKKKLPLFGKDKGGNFYFSKTKNLLEVIKDMPFYLRMISNF